jgi:hypothetical protein
MTPSPTPETPPETANAALLSSYLPLFNLRWEAHVYRATAESLRESHARVYPAGSKVYVSDARYTGPGVVAHLASEMPDMVAVRLENGNLHFYRVENVVPESLKGVKL